MAIINNVAYSWSMIRISIPALDISEDSTIMQGVSEIKWNKTRKVENNYGIGGNAINRGFGNKTCTASITMDYNTVSQLRALAGSLMDLGEFDLIISFTNAYAGEDWTATVNMDFYTARNNIHSFGINQFGSDNGKVTIGYFQNFIVANKN